MENDTDDVIRTKEMLKHLGIHKSTLYRWRKNNNFPQDVILGPNSIGWDRSSFNRWLKKRTKKPNK
jgi:predicted DNA-binding transcriptional regulator AlpA